MNKVNHEKIKNKMLNNQFFIILEDFVNEYKVSKSHPDLVVYSDKLDYTENKYKELKTHIFLQKNNLEKLNIDLNNSIRKQSSDIKKYRQTVDKLKTTNKYLIPIQNSSEGLYEEEKLIYKSLYYEIVALVFGIFISSGLTYTIFRKY